MIVVPPKLNATTVKRGTTTITPNILTGRYEVHEGDTINIIQAAELASSVTFCDGRGIDSDEGLEYGWTDKEGWYDFIYDPIPVNPNTSSSIYFIVPDGSLGHTDTVTVTVTDRCNKQTASRDLLFEVTG
jgi:hypothetical protein